MNEITRDQKVNRWVRQLVSNKKVAKKMIGKFELDDYADASGTSFRGVTVLVNGPKLIEELGDVNRADNPGDKTSKDWIFTCEGKVFTVYEWKSTNLYDSKSGLPSVEDFWAGNVLLNIGHDRKDKELAEELADELEKVAPPVS